MDSTSTPKAALEKAARTVGGQQALATAIGFADRRSVWPWFNTDRRVPAEHCPAIEDATRRKAAEAGDNSLIVLCEELRPDVAWGVLREQADARRPAGRLRTKPREEAAESKAATPAAQEA